ncbi:MAG TPA: hypothetical protein VIW21_03165 [Chthoniobacterales bacterium]|jgi:hypothetical protein
MKIVCAGVTTDTPEQAGVFRLTRTPLQTAVLALVLLFWAFSCLLPLPPP